MKVGLDFSSWPDWGSLAVAVLALIQPWILAGYRRWFRRGAVEVHETNNVELGFATYGPTVGLTGTIRALHQDIFIQQATVRIVRERDNAVLVLPWRAFRSIQIAFGGGQPNPELASSFLLPTSAPLRYNVFFSSEEFAAEFRDDVMALRQEWGDFVRAKIGEAAPDY